MAGPSRLEVKELVLGSSVSGEDAAVLRQLSKRAYEQEIRRIKASGLPYREADLESDFRKHAFAFPIDSKDLYVREAQQVVRDGRRILAKNYFGEVQYEFFGRRGLVVVDRRPRIRGYYEHVEPSAVDKAFENLKRIRLWLRTEHAGS